MIERTALVPLDQSFPTLVIPPILKDGGSVSLGRVEQDVQLSAGSTWVYVSRNHASLSTDGVNLFMNDTSSNGTLCNGVLFKRQTFPLKDGDTLVRSPEKTARLPAATALSIALLV